MARTERDEPAPIWRILRYALDTGHSPVRAFLESLIGAYREDALALLAQLQREGNRLRPPVSKLVETGLFELRGYQIRLFYCFLPGRRIILLDGMIKKQDKIPLDVMKRLRKYHRDVEQQADRTGDG